MDFNQHDTRQKKKKMVHGWMYVREAEDASYRFQYPIKFASEETFLYYLHRFIR